MKIISSDMMRILDLGEIQIPNVLALDRPGHSLLAE